MLVHLAFKRMRQEWRILLILLLALSLVTGFLALGPLYVRGVTEVDLRFALDNAAPETLQINVIAEQPLGPDEQRIIEEELGGLVTGVERLSRADYTAPQPPSNNAPGVAGVHACGYLFELGQTALDSIQQTGSCHQPFAFHDLAERVTVVEGRLPRRTPPPEAVGGVGLSDAEKEALEVGAYQRGQVEAVVTQIVAEEADLEVGSLFYTGQIFPDRTGALTSVRIVGIVEPNNPEDPFWGGNRMFLEGADIILDAFATQIRFDYGLAFHPDSYQEWVAPVVPGNTYIWQLNTDSQIVTSDNAQQVLAGLNSTRTRLRQTDPTVQVVSGYSNLLSGYGARVQSTEGPITFLAGAVLVLLLYHLINTVSLVLQQQGTEWSTITARGGSTFQLFGMQFVTVAVLGIIAFGAAFGLSRLFMLFMQTFGPLSQVLGEATITDVPFPQRSVFLALGGAVSAIIVLSLPAIPAAAQSLLRLKQAASRPPAEPGWAKYFLDGVLIVIGVLLLGRLYINAAPPDTSYGELFRTFFTQPSQVVDVIATDFSADQGLNDPFNLIAPALLITGVAMLWLRIFPKLVGLISTVTSRLRSLTTPLAVWNVERDPSHYAQLVLLLIGTLALGTASLGLSTTRDIGAWNVATHETGGAARVELDPTTNTIERVPWNRLAGVDNHAFVLRTTAQPVRETITNVNIQVVGVDAAAFGEAYPEHASLVESLVDAPALTLPGTPLAEDARQLQVQVWSESIAQNDLPEVGVEINAYLVDAVGVPFVVRLQRPGATLEDLPGTDQAPTSGPLPTPPEQWVTLSADLPTTGRVPYSLWRVGMASRQGDVSSFTHSLYLDFWQTVDENGVATKLEDYEAVADEWQPAATRDPYIVAEPETAVAPDALIGGIDMAFTGLDEAGIPSVVDGDRTALKLDYTIRNVRAQIAEPSLTINPVRVSSVPAVVSRQFTEDFRGSGQASINARTPPLSVGDTRTMQLNVGPGTVRIGLEVADVIDDFPTVAEGDKYILILPLSTARLWFNQTARPNQVFDANQVWLDIPERQPSGELQTQLSDSNFEGITGVVYAWDRYGQILREPLPSAIAGMLFAGFWVSLLLSLLDFAFYLAVTARQRSFTFGVLRSLGWNTNNIWRLLLVEQVTLVTPALVIGVLLGAALAYLILPFLGLVGSATLHIPALGVGGLVASLLLSFIVLLVIAALWLQRMSVNQVLRLGEE